MCWPRGTHGGAQFLDGERAARPGHDARPLRDSHHGEDGQFAGNTDHITLRPEKNAINRAYKAKVGAEEVRFAVEKKAEGTLTAAHIQNFLDCVRSRHMTTLGVEEAARSQVLISMSVEAYREGRVLYFDEKNWNVLTSPPAA